jgi:ferritin-like metal-binding protein YciE
MSQASKVLKEIAEGQEYTALVQAIEGDDYETVAENFQKLNELITGGKNQILEKIDSLQRQNKDNDRQVFLNAFNTRLSTTLPEWYRLDTLIKEQKVTESEVLGMGSKGDPIVRSAEGKMVIISGKSVEKGDVLRYRVTKEGDKVDFGRCVELNADFFYSLLNQNILGQVWGSFDKIEARLKPDAGEITPEERSELLAELQNIHELAATLKSEERAGISGRILSYRKQLLMDYGTKLATDFINSQEENEIKEVCGDKADLALAAHGLFRTHSYRSLKEELFEGTQLKKYNTMLSEMESNLDSMDAAMKLMEFKAGIEQVESSARAYITRLDTLAGRLEKKVRIAMYNLAEDKVCSTEEVQTAIEKSLANGALSTELKRVFRSPNDFFNLRDATSRLRQKLGNADVMASESAIKPYLTQQLQQAFARR